MYQLMNASATPTPISVRGVSGFSDRGHPYDRELSDGAKGNAARELLSNRRVEKQRMSQRRYNHSTQQEGRRWRGGRDRGDG